MERDEYERMIRAGENHWWYRSTRALLAELSAPFVPPAGDTTRYLDAAGGSGATGDWLAAAAPTVVLDVDVPAMVAATHRHPAYRPVAGDLNAVPHPDATFDAVLCVTALCHRLVPDPQHVVDELARVTRPGGVVVLMEPGVRRLRRGHDEVTHSVRRFSRCDLADLVAGAGLVPLRSTGAYSFLVPIAAAVAVVERGRPQSDVGRHSTGLRGVLPALARAERRLLRTTDLPAGLSVIAIGRKPDAPAAAG